MATDSVEYTVPKWRMYAETVVGAALFTILLSSLNQWTLTGVPISVLVTFIFTAGVLWVVTRRHYRE